MEAVGHKKESYIRQVSKNSTFPRLSYVFVFTLFVMPQYFGLPTPGFDLTVLRIMQIVMCLYIISKKEYVHEFYRLVRSCRQTKFIALYFGVLLYTMVLRVDINAFLNSFLEILSLFLMTYIIKRELGQKGFVRLIVGLTYVLCLLGLVEYGMGKTPFSYLETIKGLYTGAFYRSGSYRIMGPCNHSLAYGLFLITVTPLACIDLEKDRIDLLKRLPLLVLLALNVVLNGSRSTLAVFGLELLVLFVLSGMREKKKVLLAVAALLPFFVVFLAVFHNTSLGNYILLQLTSVIDELFGTTFAVRYGADTMRLSSSSHYRSLLPKIFEFDWLNPLLGRGRKMRFSAVIDGYVVKSVDNFYVAEYIRYAYPGLIAFLLFIGSTVIGMLREGIRRHSGLYLALAAGAVCYFVNLWWLDSLQTLKYVYVLFAIYFAADAPEKKEQEKVFVSKYIR